MPPNVIFTFKFTVQLTFTSTYPNIYHFTTKINFTKSISSSRNQTDTLSTCMVGLTVSFTKSRWCSDFLEVSYCSFSQNTVTDCDSTKFTTNPNMYQVHFSIYMLFLKFNTILRIVKRPQFKTLLRYSRNVKWW